MAKSKGLSLLDEAGKLPARSNRSWFYDLPEQHQKELIQLLKHKRDGKEVPSFLRIAELLRAKFGVKAGKSHVAEKLGEMSKEL